MVTPAEADPVSAARRALVTGGAVRVGRAISLALGRAGYAVAVHFHGAGDAAEEVVGELRAMGREAVALRADLSRPEEIRSLFERLRGEAGWAGLGLLVNNAATFPRARPGEVGPEAWDEVFAVNLRAPFFCAVEARRLMADGGCIVNIADVAAFEAWPAYVPYAATQAGLVSITRGLALAWAPEVRVNAVAPGTVLLPEGEEKEAAARRTALGRVGTPEDVADAVLYLAGASFVTGEVVRVDGGGHLR